MKKYIFFSTDINIGGGEIYTKTKTEYLIKDNWNVLCFVARPTMKNHFLEMSKYCIKQITELEFNPNLFSIRKQDKVIKIITEIINGQVNDQIIIESSKPNYSLWAELIAKRLKCMSFFYCLDEGFCFNTLSMVEYINFKCKRNEFATINLKTLTGKFAHKLENLDSKYRLNAIMENPVQDVDFDVSEICRKDFNIGTISRLEKNFLIPAIKEIIMFAKQNADKTIFYLLIGGTPNEERLNEIKSLLNSQKNITYYITGSIYPIPRKLINHADVYISVSGSVACSISCDIPTIICDVHTDKAIGIAEYTTQPKQFADGSDEYHDTKEWLSKILKEDFCKKNKKNFPYEQNDIYKGYLKHMEYIKKFDSKHEYYDINKVKIKYHIVKKVILFIFGIKGFKKFMDNYIILKSKFKYLCKTEKS